MANVIKVSSSTAPSVSAPYGDAQRQQQYADLITQRSMAPRNFGTASNAQAIQMGLTQLAQALLGKSLRGDASAAGDQADTVQRQSNAALLEALAPAINQGQQVPLNTQLDSLGPNDPTTSMTTNVALPDTINPQHQAIASALAGAGVDPKVSGQFLAQALLNKATAPPKAPIKVGAGESILAPDTYRPLYTAPAAPEKLTDAERGYQDWLQTNPGGTRLAYKAALEDQAATIADKHREPPAGVTVSGIDQVTGKPTTNLVSSRDGHVIAANVGTPIGNTAGDARAQAQTDRVVSAAGEVVQGLRNMTLLPFGADTGILGIHSSPGSGIFSVGAQALKNRVSTQEVQSFQTLIPGLAANIAQIEAQGLSPSVARMKSFDGLMLSPNDTGYTRLEKMANFRQNAEQGLNAKLTNPRVPDEQKDLMRSLLSQLKEAIPYTFADVQKLKQAKNPQATIGDYARTQGLGGNSAGAGGAAPPSFATEAEADAALAAGKIHSGDRVVVAGQTGKMQ